ncbi:23S rRNA (guanosine(2251)-2'-O)-methyltransferase RlmB [Rhizobium sp. SSA_523]|uniref:23S rRNA (guanosine(2251)-2'-O)-methyltransferase RlmB n=1 Tax=Rhizobium sp. SSA_523 TaxID=2952477 RepID=UPI002090303C|nr:23S rRNA (guanosine(2251)-2'-O)-methyltransferase RlmB [Rhizobium sp. SSA_523]MCO5730579.1 23S rRNA (guanosine(2251)-2'-O)-methyltransferase RlmB [Rhizobium sp. SSA_523]WKC24585.1 23S rRNA (guanosine(2251)-2'-O)-methyltransferase RlmB [Rhizobium sp. SSA_523]
MSKKEPTDPSARDSHYATLRRQVRDAKRERGEIPTPGPSNRRDKAREKGAWTPPQLAPEQVYLYGLHTVRAALDNPQRKLIRLSVTQNALARLDLDPAKPPACPVDIVSPQDIDRMLGPDAIHQGVMLETRPLPVRRLEALKDSPLLLVLDQVTDPHNVGAIMRSAVAFGAGAVITTQRHSPTESGVLAKSASGALELIPYIQVTNLSDALGELHRLGFATIGLDSEGPAPLETSLAGERIALVLGSEGKGLRQKTRDTVTALARLDMPGAIKSLNVSNAAAIALYATRLHLTRAG